MSFWSLKSFNWLIVALNLNLIKSLYALYEYKIGIIFIRKYDMKVWYNAVFFFVFFCSLWLFLFLNTFSPTYWCSSSSLASSIAEYLQLHVHFHFCIHCSNWKYICLITSYVVLCCQYRNIDASHEIYMYYTCICKRGCMSIL